MIVHIVKGKVPEQPKTCLWRYSLRLPCRLEASSCCDCHVIARAAVWPTRVQQAERDHVAEEEVPGFPLDGPAELFRRGL